MGTVAPCGAFPVCVAPRRMRENVWAVTEIDGPFNCIGSYRGAICAKAHVIRCGASARIASVYPAARD